MRACVGGVVLCSAASSAEPFLMFSRTPLPQTSMPFSPEAEPPAAEVSVKRSLPVTMGVFAAKPFQPPGRVVRLRFCRPAIACQAPFTSASTDRVYGAAPYTLTLRTSVGVSSSAIRWPPSKAVCSLVVSRSNAAGAVCDSKVWTSGGRLGEDWFWIVIGEILMLSVESVAGHTTTTALDNHSASATRSTRRRRTPLSSVLVSMAFPFKSPSNASQRAPASRLEREQNFAFV